jgi:hypothetical protein
METYLFGLDTSLVQVNTLILKTDIVVPAKSWDGKNKEVKSRDEFKVYRDKFK